MGRRLSAGRGRAGASVINYLISTVFNQRSSRVLREYRTSLVGHDERERSTIGWVLIGSERIGSLSSGTLAGTKVLLYRLVSINVYRSQSIVYPLIPLT